MKTGISKLFFVFAVIVSLCACSADNTSKTMICKKISFAPDGIGGITVTAHYSSVGDKTEKPISFAAKNAEDAVDVLPATDAIYKSVESMEINSGFDEQTLLELLRKLINTDELQLKCRVVANGKEYESLGDCYREIMNMTQAKGGDTA